MAKTVAPLLPPTTELLQRFGERLRLARLRRRLTAKQVAERAGMTPMTLRGLERGGAGVTMGAYLAVMQVLGIERDLDTLAAADPLGRRLQDARLTPRSERQANAEPPSPARPGAPDRFIRDVRDIDDAVSRSVRPVPATAAKRSRRTPVPSRKWAGVGGFTRAQALAELIDAEGISQKKGR